MVAFLPWLGAQAPGIASIADLLVPGLLVTLLGIALWVGLAAMLIAQLTVTRLDRHACCSVVGAGLIASAQLLPGMPVALMLLALPIIASPMFTRQGRIGARCPAPSPVIPALMTTGALILATIAPAPAAMLAAAAAVRLTRAATRKPVRHAANDNPGSTRYAENRWMPLRFGDATQRHVQKSGDGEF